MKANFVRISDIHRYNTRSNKYNFSIPYCNKTCNDTFLYHGIKDWNSLPDDVKCIKNPTMYKSSVKNFLVSNWTAQYQKDILYY